MKIWVKMSSENRYMGAWFYTLEDARAHAKRWELLIPVEFPNWPNVADDSTHSDDDGKFAGSAVPDLLDEAYRKGRRDGIDDTLDDIRCADYNHV